jgi:RNA polymerase sigma-70 factor (ECF subfamily)
LPPTPLSEEEQQASLVRRCVEGDGTAWGELVRVHNRRVYNICYRFTGSPDDAEDLAQEVFIKVYRTLKTYDASKGAFTTWVTTVTRNLLVDHFRRTKQERLTDSLDAPASSDADAGSTTRGELIEDTAAVSPDQKVSRSDTQKLVQQALQKLSPDLREAVILRDLQDMDYKEIAAALRVPEGTVKSRINRGRAELSRLLQRTYKQVM